MKIVRKNIQKIVIIFVSFLFFTSCNDDFMERYPETKITEKVFFKTPKDLETYTNGMYGWLGTSYWDVASDNVVYGEDAYVYKLMRGEYDETTIGSWNNDWKSIRTINFMLARVGQVKGDQGEIDHYIGLARMFRALRYYSLVKMYSDVPWYDKDLQTTNELLLYKPQDSRSFVVDKIMEDLDFATTKMKDAASTTRIFRNVAWAVKARIALTEGTYRKYHSELGLTDGDKYLKIARDAAKAIIDTQKYSLSDVTDEFPAYQTLFCSLDLLKNPEMILVGDYDKTLGRMHNANSMMDWTSGLSRDLMEDYLYVENNTAKPFTSVVGYATKTVNEIFENRDPRLEQTFMKPGYIRALDTKPYRPKLTLGGYPQIKFNPRTYDQCSWDKAYTDLPIIRYAEMLLIYAETKAELGELTQADVDITINKIRQRAGVPEAKLSDWLSNIDQVQANRYSNVQSTQKGAVYEVRRERRIELACEGFRYGDLMRWKCGKLLEKPTEGMYIPAYGQYDITGDGNPDVAIVPNRAAADAIPQNIKEKYKLTVYVLEGNTIELSQGNKGYIRLVAQVNANYDFKEPKYYYKPLDEQDMLDNSNLVQNKFWKVK